ncbi:MAG: NAD(P)-dependent glycerol-3-phosphate dehydrogenase [Oscillospiraceae bacterium]|nr:NAD(P)-dependent glycerol-3-phosphate dehydrogenase [Oscillospiraceae bacterium]
MENKNNKNIFILGCGFGTALAVLWNGAGHRVVCYSKFPEEIETILRDGEHKKLLPGVAIPKEISFTSDISEAINADIIVFAVPSKFAGGAAEELSPFVSPNAVIVNVGKGFAECACGSPDKIICRLSEIIKVYIPNNPIVILTGPCHAEEVGRGIPTTVVTASDCRESAAAEPAVACPSSTGYTNPAEYIQQTLQTKTLRIYLNDDIVGCELGGALKNPIALCCGITKGMGLGDNTSAALMTRGLAEIKRLGTALGAKWKTFTGLAGVGDLIVTCTSPHSRNFRAGNLIGEGVPVADAVAQVGTVEGYECVKIAYRLARENNVNVPIFEQLYKVCYEGLSPSEALKQLMERPQRHERESFWE